MARLTATMKLFGIFSLTIFLALVCHAFAHAVDEFELAPIEYPERTAPPGLTLYFLGGDKVAAEGDVVNGRRHGLWTFYGVHGGVIGRGRLEDYQRQLNDARNESNRIIEEARQTADA